MAKVSQKADQVYSQLLSGLKEKSPGEGMPSVRELMRQYGVSQVTIDRAVKRLKAEAYITARPGKGMFVAESRRIGTIGLVTREDVSGFTRSILEHLRRACEAAEYNVKFAYDQQERTGESLRNLQADAAIIIPSSRPEELEGIFAQIPFTRPTVMVDIVSDELIINAVGSDNMFGGALVARHLIDLGHRRLALLKAEPDTITTKKRIEGFLNQAELMGVEDVQIIPGHFNRGIRGGTYGIGHEAMTEWLKEHQKPSFTAVFADSDRGAFGAMKAMHEAGILMPQEVSIVGFDDIAEARFLHPSLTSVRQRIDLWASHAVEIINRSLKGELDEVVRVKVKPELIVRGSTSAPGEESKRNQEEESA